MSWASLAVAILSGLATVYWDWRQKQQGEAAKIENVGLQEKAHEELETQAAETEIRQAQEDVKKNAPNNDWRDFT